MGFAGEECKILGSRGVLEFLDVGIVNAETKLVEFFLDVFNDLEISLSVKLWGVQDLPSA